MRGAFVPAATAAGNVRITPAHAGSITRKQPSGESTRDHPRACGEHKSGLVAYILGQGSPPRMRGAYVVNGIYLDKSRITPAHAGSIKIEFQKRGAIQDHPRACGEHYCV